MSGCSLKRAVVKMAKHALVVRLWRDADPLGALTAEPSCSGLVRPLNAQ